MYESAEYFEAGEEEGREVVRGAGRVSGGCGCECVVGVAGEDLDLLVHRIDAVWLRKILVLVKGVLYNQDVAL